MTMTTTTRTRFERMDMFSKFFISSSLVIANVKIKIKNQNQSVIFRGRIEMILSFSLIFRNDFKVFGGLVLLEFLWQGVGSFPTTPSSSRPLSFLNSFRVSFRPNRGYPIGRPRAKSSFMSEKLVRLWAKICFNPAALVRPWAKVISNPVANLRPNTTGLLSLQGMFARARTYVSTLRHSFASIRRICSAVNSDDYLNVGYQYLSAGYCRCIAGIYSMWPM